ncbi:EamA family transporter [Leifsonia flava]|uniref:EamA/RhaT family transporter n=1 Tax=Orlajensenia leifsoniae TaxID=2561933 RepID=A0A4Y9R6M0_9MICO|nr:EamA family transporter [Leifsonia flava]TFW00262.1 EamA/RhaT family transporter [Leifsonia flava]
MVTVILGVSGALIFGAADFLGGLAAKRMSALLTTAVAALTGLVLLVILLPFLGGVWSSDAVLWGALSGITGAIAISLLYACLAIGPMSILSPLTAVVSAIVPLTVALAGGETLAALGYWAIGLALIAVVMVGFVPEKGAVRPSLKGILMAVGSGAAIGAFLVLIDLSPDDSGLVPLVLNRAVNAGIMFGVVGILFVIGLRRRRHHSRHEAASLTGMGTDADGHDAMPVPASVAASDGRTMLRTGITLAVACGVIDAVANTLLLLGIRVGDLSVMSVLTALYPAGTILLAAIVLRERIAPVQWIGLALALTAAGMLALA